jgi:WD40 repeat protein
MRLWNVGTGELIRASTGHKEGIETVAFAPDGRTALSGDGDDTLRVWDLSTGNNVRSIQKHFGWVTSLAMMRDGNTTLVS